MNKLHFAALIAIIFVVAAASCSSSRPPLGIASQPICSCSTGAGGAGGATATTTASTTAASSSTTSSTTTATASTTAASSSSSTGGGITPGGESTTPAPACTGPTPTARTATVVQYGTTTPQACDRYAPTSPSGDADVMIVSSGFTGGTRTAAAWVLWARHRADLGHVVYVCDTRHAATGGVNMFPAAINDARCVLRTVGAASPTGHAKVFGASSGGNLAALAVGAANLTSLSYGAQTQALDADGTCPLAWSTSDADIASRLVTWADPSDLRVKAKIQNSAQTNMDTYLNLPTGEASPLYFDRAGMASPLFFTRTGMAPLLAIHSAGDFVVYPEHDAGTGAAGLTCTSVHPTGLPGMIASVRAVGVNATLVLTPCPATQHLPTFSPPTVGDCTADAF